MYKQVHRIGRAIKLVLLSSLFTLVLGFPFAAYGQTYPTAPVVQLRDQPPFQSRTTPAYALNGALAYLAYQDQSTGNLFVSTSTNGGTTWSTAVNTGISLVPTNDPFHLYYHSATMASFNGRIYIAYFCNAASDACLISTSDGINFTSPIDVGFGGLAFTPTSKVSQFESPGIIVIGSKLVLAVCETVDDNYNAKVFYLSSFDGVTFNGGGNELTTYASCGSDPRMAVFGGNLYFTFDTTVFSGYPNIAYTDPSFSTTTDLGQVSTAGDLGNDPILFTSGGGIFVGGRSASSNKFVVTGSNNGGTFSAPTTYSPTIGFSPSVLPEPFGGTLVLRPDNGNQIMQFNLQ